MLISYLHNINMLRKQLSIYLIFYDLNLLLSFKGLILFIKFISLLKTSQNLGSLFAYGNFLHFSVFYNSVSTQLKFTTYTIYLHSNYLFAFFLFYVVTILPIKSFAASFLPKENPLDFVQVFYKVYLINHEGICEAWRGDDQ